MRRLLISILPAIFLLIQPLSGIEPYPEKKLVVAIMSYNNAQWYKKNLDSVFSQNYQNYRIIYVDDCSPDGTGNLVEAYINETNQYERTTVIKNSKRRRKAANLYYAVHSCDDDEIILELDGDDWFAHENVLSLINKIYTEENVWVTYGNITTPHGSKPNCLADIPQSVIQKNSFRRYYPGKCFWGQLRTYYVWLFKKINTEDFKFRNKFMPMTIDAAIMFPMFEMAGNHLKFVQDRIYVYNQQNPINDQKIDSGLQYAIEVDIRNRKPYQRLQDRAL